MTKDEKWTLLALMYGPPPKHWMAGAGIGSPEFWRAVISIFGDVYVWQHGHHHVKTDYAIWYYTQERELCKQSS